MTISIVIGNKQTSLNRFLSGVYYTCAETDGEILCIKKSSAVVKFCIFGLI